MGDTSPFASRSHPFLLVVDIQERLRRDAEREAVASVDEQAFVRTADLSPPIIVTLSTDRITWAMPSPRYAPMRSPPPRRQRHLVIKIAFRLFRRTLRSVGGLGEYRAPAAGDTGDGESHSCVVQTALSALREGFDVHVVGDSCCSRPRHRTRAHWHACVPGAVITTTESVSTSCGRVGNRRVPASSSASSKNEPASR